jgi:hypothetical protein
MPRPRILALVFPAAILLPLACGSPPNPVAPAPTPLLSPQQTAMWSEAQNVFETRCVVCHGCYDAPCQLKLGTSDGIARGASGDKVYDGTRLIAATPTRLDIDAHDVDGWRKKGFHPVLPARRSAERGDRGVGGISRRTVSEEPARRALHLRAPFPGEPLLQGHRQGDVLSSRALAHADRRRGG